jgi:hypothetical protein
MRRRPSTPYNAPGTGVNIRLRAAVVPEPSVSLGIPRRGRSASPAFVIGAVAGIALVVLLAGPFTGLVGADPVPVGTSVTSAAPGNEWAYGGGRWTNVTGTTGALNGSTYSIHAFLGLVVVLHQVNTSSTSFELTANRTIEGDVFAEYCHPTCSSPTASANLSIRAWEFAHASANFTTTANVTGPSGPVPALGLVNSAVTSTSSYSESEVVKISGALLTHVGTTTLDLAGASRASVSFSPALGLVPDPLNGATNWTSHSAYSATGSWTIALRYEHHPWLGSTTTYLNTTPSGNVSRTGNLTLFGSLLGSVTLRGGILTQAVALRIPGPFNAREGFILVPSGGDLFGSSGSSQWQPNEAGNTTASTQAVDFGSVAGQPTILSSATSYDGNSTTTDTAGAADGGGLVTAMAPTTNTGAQTLQAQPEAVSTAGLQSNCFVGGACPGGAPASHFPFGGLVVLAVAVVGLTVVVVGLVVARQPPRKEPVTPYASLYPPASGGRPTVPPGRPPAPATPPATDDPLDHLW